MSTRLLDATRAAARGTPAQVSARRKLTQLARYLGLGTVGALTSLAASDHPSIATISGWLVPSRQRPTLTSLQVCVDERIVQEVAITELGAAPRPAVEGRTEWTIAVPADDITPWSRVEVFARGGRHRVSLGVLLAQPSGLAPRGAISSTRSSATLDLPKPNRVVAHPACMVAGWAIIDGAAPDRVEVFIEGQPAQPVRRAIPRPDIAGPARFTCGFESVVSLGNPRPGDQVTMVVRATGVSGTVWHSEPVTVILGDDGRAEVGPAAEPIRPRANVATSRAGRPPGEPGPIKVVVFTHSLRLGGGQLHLQEMALRMAAAGQVELTVVAPEDGALRPELQAAGIKVHITRGYTVQPDGYAGQLAEFGALLQTLGAQVVMANTLGVFPAVDAALHAGLPVAWVIHESFELPVFEYLNWGSSGLHPAIHARMHATLAEADAVVFETPSTLSMYVAAMPTMNAVLIRYGVDAAGIRNFIDRTSRTELRARAGYGPDDTVFICMGVFEPRKATVALIEAFAAATSHLSGPQLALIGAHPAPYCSAVEEMLDARRLRARIRSVPISPDIYPWYRLADFIISASDVESLPRSLLEAMTFGLPVVTTDTFGTGELVEDGINGMLCSPNSHTALVAAISRAIRLDPDQRAEMGRRSTERLADLGGFGYDDEYTQLLYRLAGRAAPSGGSHD